MTSQAQAEMPLTGVRGVAFLGFPLHAAGRPSDERAAHLFEVTIPMLFMQGTRDQLADLRLLQPVLERLGKRATLKLFDNADHAGSRARIAVLRAVAAEIGATPNQVALAWLLGGEVPVVPVFGASSVAQLDEALGAADLVLDEEIRARLDNA